MTQDRLPHAGERDGLYYSMGYSGHGTQMSVHMGERMADVMDGDATANPWRDRDWPAIPGHFGPPWFLPRGRPVLPAQGQAAPERSFVRFATTTTSQEQPP